MRRASEYALVAAKEITIARVGNTNLAISKEGGENVAAFFEAVYKKVLEITKEADEA